LAIITSSFRWGGLSRYWPLLGAGVLIALAAFFLARSAKEPEKTSSLPEFVPGEGVKIKEVHYAQDDPDRGLKWELDAAEVLFSEDNEKVLFRDFVLRLESSERAPMKLTGKEGTYFRKQGLIVLKGQIRGQSDDGYRMSAEEVTIEEAKRKANSDGPVKVWGPFFTVEGVGFSADLENETIKINKDVTTTITRLYTDNEKLN